MHAELSFLNGPLRGQSVALKLAQRFVLGRGVDVSLQVPDPGVSRQHAVVELETNGWMFVTDLGSSNGTFVGGKRSLSNGAAAVLLDYKPTESLRLLGAGRVDFYDKPNRPYGSYRPGEEFRDYPFHPDKNDLEVIRGQMRLSEVQRDG